MTGTAKVKPPKNNAEFARNIQKRVDQVEHPTSARVGQWVLSTQDDTGNLIASHVDGGSIILAAQPAPTEDGSPDDVTSSEFAHIKVARIANQQINRGGAPKFIQWDSVEHQSPGWGFGLLDTDLVIPESGTYLLTYFMVPNQQSGVRHKAMVDIDGSWRMEQEMDPASGGDSSTSWRQEMSLTSLFDLSVGTRVRGAAWVAAGLGGGIADIGYSSTNPTVFTSMSLTRLPVG